MSNDLCIIKLIHENITHDAILTFVKNKISVESGEVLSEDSDYFDEIHIDEEQKSAILKKVILRAKRVDLKDGLYPDSAFINLDHQRGNLSCYTHFVKDGKKGLRQKCDFAIVTRVDNNLHVAISEMKSSISGINDRCHGQFSRTQIFLEYIVRLLNDISGNNNHLSVFFHKIVFMPNTRVSIATPETTTPTEGASESFHIEICPDKKYIIAEVEITPDGVGEVSAKELIEYLKKLPIR